MVECMQSQFAHSAILKWRQNISLLSNSFRDRQMSSMEGYIKTSVSELCENIQALSANHWGIISKCER